MSLGESTSDDQSGVSPSPDYVSPVVAQGSRAAHAPAAKRTYGLRSKVRHLMTRVGRGAEAIAPYVLPILPNRNVVGEVKVGPHVVRYYKHWPDDGRLIAEWDQLAQETPGATVYHSPYWQQPTARTPDAVATLRLMTVHNDAGKLVAAVPLERRWGGHWRTIGYLTTAFHDPLVAIENREQVVDALVRGVLQIDPDLKDLTFQMLSPGSPYLDLLPRVAKEAGLGGSDASLTTTDTVVPLAATWEAYLESLPGHDRRELRRKIRKCEEKGRARFVINDTEQTITKALRETFDLMEAEGGGKARKTKWLFRPHMKLAAPPLAQSGRMIVYQLYVEDQLAAGNIALPQQNRQMMFNGAINAKMSHWSPGIVLWGMIIRRAIELGQTSLDLLRGLSTYKHELGAAEFPLMQLKLTRH
jgi:CelD/BcsL family acetyltransferase involved in cellulose biosynthesis